MSFTHLNTEQMSPNTRALVEFAHAYQRVPLVGGTFVVGASFLLHGEALCKRLFGRVSSIYGSQNSQRQLQEGAAAYQASGVLFFSPFFWQAVPNFRLVPRAQEPVNTIAEEPSPRMIFPFPGDELSVTPRWNIPIVGPNFDGRSRSTSAASAPIELPPADEIEVPGTPSSQSTFITVEAPRDPRQAVFERADGTEDSLRSGSQSSFEMLQAPQDPRQEAFQSKARSESSASTYSVI